MDARELLFQALETDRPRAALQRAMQRWLEAGMERPEILALVEAAQQELRSAGQEEQAEWVAELLEGLNGWCRV